MSNNSGNTKNAQEPSSQRTTLRIPNNRKRKIAIKTVILSVAFTALLGSSITLSSPPRQTEDNSLTRSTTVNVKNLGATGNGTSDDTFAIKKALKSMPPEGGTIFFPSGTYLITEMIDLPDNVILSGSSTIKGSKEINMFQSGNNNSFIGLTFSDCRMALFANSRTNILVDGCRFTNIQTAAINFYGSKNSEVKNSSFYDIVSSSVVVDNDASNINIHDNNFDNPNVYGGYAKEQISGHIYVLNGDRIFVSDNIVRNNGGQGIIFAFNSATMKGTTNSIAKGNTCEGNGQEGITSFGGTQKVSKGNSITGNISRNNRFHQIECWQSDNCLIQDNTVDELSNKGNLAAIMVFNSSNVNVLSNNVIHARGNGIDIAYGSSNCTISGNLVNNTNMAGYEDTYLGQGILLDTLGGPLPSYITISDNRIVSTSKASTILLKKAGVYSTYITNQHNTLSKNYVEGYYYTVHPYAIKTCDSYTAVK